MPKPNRKGNQSAQSSNGPQANPVVRPEWPPLEPLPSTEDLSLHTVARDQILTIPNLWTSTLCKKYVKFLSTLPLTTTPGTPKRGEAVRVNDRFQVDDSSFAEILWSETGLRELVLKEAESEESKPWGGEVLGLNPNIRIYRYKKGQFFDQHCELQNDVTLFTSSLFMLFNALKSLSMKFGVDDDESNAITFPSSPPVRAKTTWTLLLYLTSSSNGCIGGETVFYPEPSVTGKKAKKTQQPLDPIVVGLETGMALLHKHGKDCMLHEGREVTDGEKWVIRSDLCVRAK